jgi:N-acetylglucosaminyl-diphospho-decaprenol L-rhamnosyltransferase
MPEANVRVGVCIVNHDSFESLEVAVNAFQIAGFDHIVVVDTASREQLLRGQLSDRIIVVELDSNVGYGRAVNVGIPKLEECDYFVVSNPDVEFDSPAVSLLIQSLEEHPDVALIGPELLNKKKSDRFENGRRFPVAGFMVGHLILTKFWRNNPFSQRYFMSDVDRTIFWHPEWISGAFFVIRSSVWDQVGGFDERYFMYMEDVDLARRLRSLGWKVAINPTAAVVHIGGVSTSHHPYRMAVAHSISAWRYQRSWSSKWKFVPQTIALFIVIALRTSSTLAGRVLRALTGLRKSPSTD